MGQGTGNSLRSSEWQQKSQVLEAGIKVFVRKEGLSVRHRTIFKDNSGTNHKKLFCLNWRLRKLQSISFVEIKCLISNISTLVRAKKSFILLVQEGEMAGANWSWKLAENGGGLARDHRVEEQADRNADLGEQNSWDKASEPGQTFGRWRWGDVTEGSKTKRAARLLNNSPGNRVRATAPISLTWRRLHFSNKRQFETKK